MLDSANVVACGAAGLCMILLAGCATTAEPDWTAADSGADAITNTIVPAFEEPPATPPAQASSQLVIEPPPIAKSTQPLSPPPSPLASPPASPPPTSQAPIIWVPLGQWCSAHGLAKPCAMNLDSFPAFSLNSTNGSFILRTGSPQAQWNGLDVRLAFAPQLIGDQPFIHSLDLNKTLQPLLTGGALIASATNPVIVIDPGHGGDDAGTRSVLGNGYERDFTLDWARRLAPLMAARGWQVFLTRTNDVHLSIPDRIAFAEEHKAALFVSLHFNASGSDSSQAGLETYCLTPPGMFSSVTREFGDDPHLTFPNNAFDAQNLQLAFCIHRALLAVSDDRDRGVRHARFLSVLRGQNRPAVLVEGGYLSNPRQARRIADPAYRQKLAEAIAKALADLPDVASQQPESNKPTAQLRAQEPQLSSQIPSPP